LDGRVCHIDIIGKVHIAGVFLFERFPNLCLKAVASFASGLLDKTHNHHSVLFWAKKTEETRNKKSRYIIFICLEISIEILAEKKN
jgi:hypothetical protein